MGYTPDEAFLFFPGASFSGGCLSGECRHRSPAVSSRSEMYGERHSPRPFVRTGDTQTIGDQIRQQGVSLKLLRRELAAQFGVTPSTIFNWESNRSKPEARLMPVVEAFLGPSFR